MNFEKESKLFRNPDQIRIDLVQKKITFAVRDMLANKVAGLIRLKRERGDFVGKTYNGMDGVRYELKAKVERNTIPFASKWVVSKTEPIGVQMFDDNQKVAELYVSWDGRIAYMAEAGFKYNSQLDMVDCVSVEGGKVAIDVANESLLRPQTLQILKDMAQKATIGG